MSDPEELTYVVSLQLELSSTSPQGALEDFKKVVDYTGEMVALIKCVETGEVYVFNYDTERPCFLDVKEYFEQGDYMED